MLTSFLFRRILGPITVLVLAAFAVFAAPGPADARTTHSCGTVSGVPIHAHDISCRTARRIYKADMSGHLPAGWTCSASLARCYYGEVGRSSEYMWWRRTTYRPLVGAPILGGKIYPGPNGEGFGAPHPDFIYNGGDASGSIDHVRWSGWGAPVAHGRGRHPIFKPRGGYFRRPVVALLKATDLGRCEGRPAYLRLLIREPRRPGGPFGPWRSWAGPQSICEPYGSSFGRAQLERSRRITFKANGGPAQVKPATLYASPTNGPFGKRLVWSGWGGNRTMAEGTVYYDTCEPDCSSGYHSTSGEVILSGVHRCAGALRYSLLRIVYSPAPEYNLRATYNCAGTPTHIHIGAR